MSCLLYASTAVNAQTWSWVSKSTGTGAEEGTSVATDASGNNYVGGLYTNNPAVFGSTTLTAVGNGDGFLAKYNSSGTAQWAVKLAGTLFDRVTDIVTDGSDVFVAGAYRGTIVLYSTNATTIGITGGSGSDNAFIAKYNSSGVVQWALPYVNNSQPWDLAISPSQSKVFMSGEGNGQLFVACYSYTSTPSAPVWTVTSSGSASQAMGIAADNSGNSYFVASYSGSAASGTLSSGSTYTGNNGSLLVKLTAAGATSWIQNIGSSTAGVEDARGVELDASGNVYIGGQYTSSANISGITLTNAGMSDVFVAKYSNAGSVQWAKRLGGTGNDLINGFTANTGGDVYMYCINAENNSVAFGCKTYPSVFGNTDNKIVLYKYNNGGLVNGSAAPLVNNSGTSPGAVSLDASGNAILVGSLTGTLVAGTFSVAGTGDVYITKVGSFDELPVAASTDVHLCGIGSSTVLTASGPTGSTIKWYNSSMTLLTTGTSYNTPTVSVLSSTVYYVSSTVSSCESARIPITVTAHAINQVSVTPTNTTICNGSCITVTFTNATTAILTPGSTTVSSPFVFCPTAGNNFTLTNTVAGFCEFPGTFSVNVIITPPFAGTYSASIGTASSCTPAVTGTSKPIATTPTITTASMPTSTVLSTFRCQLANTVGWMGARSVGISDFTFIGTYTVEVYEVDASGVRNVVSSVVAPDIYYITGPAPFAGNIDFNDPLYCVGFDASAPPFFVDPTPGIGDYFFDYYIEAAGSLPSTTALTAYSAKIFCADVRQVTTSGCTINKKSFFRIANNGVAGGKNGRMFVESEEGENEDAYRSLEIFPNPTNSVVYIPLTSDDKNVQVTLTDNIGKLVMKATNLESNHGELNMESLPAGIYFYTILKNNTTYKGKIVKH